MQGEDDATGEENGRPSPFRNNAIMEDLMAVQHLTALHAAISECPPLADAIVMFKVWLRQRDLPTGGSFNGFLSSMLMVYLIKQRQLNTQMSSYQLFRVTLGYLGSGAILKGISLAEEPSPHVFEAFKEAFPVVFLDQSGRLNLTSRVTLGGIKELQHEANLAMGYLKEDAKRGFQALFLQPVSFSLKFDQYFTMQPPPSLLKRPRSEPLDDRNWDDRLIAQMQETLEDALHEKLPLIVLRFPLLSSWSLGESAPSHSRIVGGVMIDPATEIGRAHV